MGKCYLLQRFKVLTILALFMTDFFPPINGSLVMQQSIVKNVLEKCKTAIDKCRMTGAPCRKVSFNKDSESYVIFDQQQYKASTTQSITTTTRTTTQIPTTTALTTTTPTTTTTATTKTTPSTTDTTPTTALTTTTQLTTTTTALATTTTSITTTTPLTTTPTQTSSTTPTPTPPPISYISIKYISQSNDQTTLTHNFNTSALTICFWMKMSCLLCGIFAIFNDPPNNDCNSHLIYSENYKIFLFGYSVPPKVFNEGQLYHICIAWNKKRITYYADGQRYFTKSISDIQLVGNRFIVGNDVDPVSDKCIANENSQSFVGQIAGAFMWNHFLNSSEVTSQYEGTLSSSSPAVTWSQMLNFQTTSAITKENLVVES